MAQIPSTILLVCLAALFAGCTSDPYEQGVTDSSARLYLSDATYEDRWCNDNVPISFTVFNEGPKTALGVVAAAQGGYQSYQSHIGDIPPGGRVTVNAGIEANDSCGSDDNYTVLLTAEATNSARAAINVEITI